MAAQRHPNIRGRFVMRRTLIVFSLALGLIGAGLIKELIQPVFLNDATYLTYATALLTIGVTFTRSWRDWMCEHGFTLLLGLFGTVLGFSMAIAGIGDTSAALKSVGVLTALNTTIVGMACHIYLIILQRVAR